MEIAYSMKIESHGNIIGPELATPNSSSAIFRSSVKISLLRCLRHRMLQRTTLLCRLIERLRIGSYNLSRDIFGLHCFGIIRCNTNFITVWFCFQLLRTRLSPMK